MQYFLFVLISLFGGVVCYPMFGSRIPNGISVPNPCKTPAVWMAVGHYNPTQHTLFKNPFAKDFKAHNFTWTPDLCREDSDGDGKTNGEELGDPGCKWNVGANPALQAQSHPGICEPIGDTKCHHQDFRCECVNDISLCKNLVNSIPSH